MNTFLLSQLASLKRGFINLAYPPICLNCKEGMHDDAHPLCRDCLDLLELIEPAERCPYCFSADFIIEKKVCQDCAKRAPLLNGMAAAFDYVGPAACLIRRLKYSDQSYLANGLAAYMTAQFLRLEWPMPDLLIPVPIALTHWIDRGYNQSELLAQGMSELLKCPVKNALIRKSGDYSQAGLSHKQRLQLDGSLICLKKNQQLQDKCILLIDDVMTTGSTLCKCAEALMEDCPSHIYSLTACRT